MIVYRRFLAALDDVDVDELAARAGVTVDELEAIAAGGLAPSPDYRGRLARALDVDVVELFRLDDHLEEALAGAPSRYVTDPTTLRIVDHRL